VKASSVIVALKDGNDMEVFSDGFPTRVSTPPAQPLMKKQPSLLFFSLQAVHIAEIGNTQRRVPDPICVTKGRDDGRRSERTVATGPARAGCGCE
jgi:hypothetical protein